MQIGMIGLGRMGGNMVRRLLAAGHQCVVHATRPASVNELAREGAIAAHTLPELLRNLTSPRAVWLMVPAEAVETIIADLTELLDRGDIIIDGGNSHFGHAPRRAQQLASRGIHFVDVGTSGGVWGRERGYCLMIGGEPVAVQRIEPVCRALAPGPAGVPAAGGRPAGAGSAAEGYLHCGPAGAGHFVKMVHNAIEYGLMAAYAEGFNLLRHAGAELPPPPAGEASVIPAAGYPFDLPAIAELWRRGSVVSSWLLDLAARALAEDRGLDGFEGHVSDSGEGRWAVQTAVDLAAPVPVLATALFARFSSRGEGDFGDRLLSALRRQFGGHAEAGRSAGG